MNLSGILLAGGQSRRLGVNKLLIMTGRVPLFIDQIFKLSFFCSEIIISTTEQNLPFISRELRNIKGHLKNYSEILKVENVCNINPGERVRSFLDRNEVKIVLDDIGVIRPAKKPAETGPIAGIYSGLKEVSNYYSLIMAFDMPFISFRMIKTLVEIMGQDVGSDGKILSSGMSEKSNDAFIIKTEKGFEVLSSIYSKGCLDALERNIINGDNKISDIFNHIKVKVIGEETLKARGLDLLNFFNINKIEDFRRYKDIWENGFLECEKNIESVNTFFRRWAGFFFR